MLLHGGFWRDRYDRTLEGAVARDLVAHGFAVWNLEYRRLGSGGGWPTTFDDVVAGIQACPVAGETVAIGHSAGGHLALWAAAERLVDRAVSQAGVVDLDDAALRGLSEHAALSLVGGQPELFALASPFRRLPLGVPQLLVHGVADDTVPIEMSRRYRDAAVAAGDDVELVETPEGHYEHLEPASASWRAVVGWL